MLWLLNKTGLVTLYPWLSWNAPDCPELPVIALDCPGLPRTASDHSEKWLEVVKILVSEEAWEVEPRFNPDILQNFFLALALVLSETSV